MIFNQCVARNFKTSNTWLFSQGHWPLFPEIIKKMTTANTTIVDQCGGIKITPTFCQIGKKTCTLVCCGISVISLRVPWDEKGWKSLIQSTEVLNRTKRWNNGELDLCPTVFKLSHLPSPAFELELKVYYWLSWVSSLLAADHGTSLNCMNQFHIVNL